MKKSFSLFGSLGVAASLCAAVARAADAPSPPPSGPQADGPFSKVILDAD